MQASLSMLHTWDDLLDRITDLVGKRPADLNGVLFLIGMQELGRGPKRFSKEQKQDLLHVGVCAVLVEPGYYERAGVDKDNWPLFTLIKPLPFGDVFAQEDLLKAHVMHYFTALLNE
jgi:hypothetical protein